MRKTAFAIALLMSGAAIAQTADTSATTQPDVDVNASVGTQTDGDVDVDADMDAGTTATTNTNTTTGTSIDQSGMNHSTMSHGTAQTGTVDAGTSGTMTMASAQVVQPGNSNPEEDARGISVISAPAMVPAGWNGIAGTGVGGPLVDPATGETMQGADTNYPACSATVTDNCVQTYERGRSRS